MRGPVKIAQIDRASLRFHHLFIFVQIDPVRVRFVKIFVFVDFRLRFETGMAARTGAVKMRGLHAFVEAVVVVAVFGIFEPFETFVDEFFCFFMKIFMGHDIGSRSVDLVALDAVIMR